MDIIPYNSFGYRSEATKENLVDMNCIYVFRLQISNIKSYHIHPF